MASHLSSIGMNVASQDEYVELVNRVAEDCEAYDSPYGQYLRWSSRSGAELWLQLDDNNELVGMAPHFSGESVVRVKITGSIARPDDSALDGAWHAWADPGGELGDDGCYPFVFDAPDAKLHDDLDLPTLTAAQIVAFAHEVSVFATPEEFSASQGEGRRFASRSFIPTGLFSSPEESNGPPLAHAIFTGQIVKSERRTNDLTEDAFYWVLVDTLGGVYDVVIDPALLDATPTIGGILSGSFWLSGRIND